MKIINAEGVLLKAAATPSQRIRDELHKVWVLIKLSRGSTVMGGYCTCTAGYSKCCYLVIAAILYKIELAGEHGFIDPSVLKEHVLRITLVIKTYRQEGTRYGNCRAC